MAAAPTVIILHGEDSLRHARQLKRFRAQMGADDTASLNIHELDGETSGVHEVLAAANSLPFLADRRLVIVRGMLRHLQQRGAKRALAQLVEALPNLPATARLVFVEDGDLRASHPILRFARESESARILHYPVAKDISGWLIRRAMGEYDAEIEPSAARALAAVTGRDLRRADHELLKLVSYTNGARTIREEDVIAMTPYVAPANIFHMVDALATGRGPAALAILQDLLAEKGRDPIMLFGMIIRQYRLLILAREQLDQGAGRQVNLASALGIHSFVARKLGEQARRYTLPRLQAIYRKLHQQDIAIKSGEREAALALQMLVAELTLRPAAAGPY